MLKRFAAARDGSFALNVALLAIPLLLGVGVAVDYSSATLTRADMQNALDGAALVVTTMPKNSSKSAREAKLQEAYEANGGEGDVKLTNIDITPAGAVIVAATADYPMPTAIMGLARMDSVPIVVGTAVTKDPRLVEATFKIVKVSGWWNKTMTLYGSKPGETEGTKLMQINYSYNGFGDPKGYGTTIAYTISKTSTGKEKLTQVQQQVCTTKVVASFTNLPDGAITQTGGGKKYVTTCVTDPANGSGAVINVGEMDSLYLQMDVPSGKPKVLKSNDPATSDRLYIEDKEVAKGQLVDIFTVVECGKTSTQAWEDGGTTVPAPVVNADFFYSVSGKCGFSQLASRTAITK